MIVTKKMINDGWRALASTNRHLYIDKAEVETILTAALSAQPAPAVPVMDGWRPICEADREITHQQHFPDIDLTIRNSDRYWVRDADGRVYEASWTEDGKGRDYWWDWEGESPVDPVEFMPHPLDPRFAADLQLAPHPAPQPVAVKPLTLTYTNWRGEISERTIIPKLVWFGSTEWHDEPQWLLKAVDTEKGAERDFALKDFGSPPADLREENERLKAQLNMATDELTDVASILSCLDEFRPTVDSINATIRALEESAALKGGEADD